MPATADPKELLIGAGCSRVKKLFKDGRNEWSSLVTPNSMPTIKDGLFAFVVTAVRPSRIVRPAGQVKA